MTVLDALVESSYLSGLSTAGVPIPALRQNARPGTAWTPDEDAFLRFSLGWFEESDIARFLGRTLVAVRLRWKRDLHLPAPSKHPDWLTGQAAANALGVDVHLICRLADLGILPARILPGSRRIHAIRCTTFHRWVINPDHWIYFKLANVRDPHLRRLLDLKRSYCDEEWWTPGQVARYHGIHSETVKRYIYRGQLSGVRWNNWRIRKSDAINPALKFYLGKGNGPDLDWSEAADAFLILARAVGLSWAAIGRLMKWPRGRAHFRLDILHQTNAIRRLVARHDLRVTYNPRTGALWADWKHYRRRFPSIADALKRFRARQPLSNRDRPLVCGVLAAWLNAFAGRNRELRTHASRLPHSNQIGDDRLRAVHRLALRAGINLFAKR